MEACLNLPKERYAKMSINTVVPLRQPDEIDDPLTAILRAQPEITAMIDMKNNYALPKL